MLFVRDDIAYFEEVDGNTELASHAYEEVGEGQAIGPPRLEYLFGGRRVLLFVAQAELRGVQQDSSEMQEPSVGIEVLRHDGVSPLPHLGGEPVGNDDRRRLRCGV